VTVTGAPAAAPAAIRATADPGFRNARAFGKSVEEVFEFVA
jgi:hypothetical protein